MFRALKFVVLAILVNFVFYMDPSGVMGVRRPVLDCCCGE